MPNIDWMSNGQQSSVNAGGLLSPHGFFVPARMHLTATGGIVGTAYGVPATIQPGGSGAPGFPGMGVTCLPNGVYDVIHPPTRFAQAFPFLNQLSHRQMLTNWLAKRIQLVSQFSLRRLLAAEVVACVALPKPRIFEQL